MYKIKRTKDYFEIIDSFGRFVCSADSLREAEDEIFDLEKDLF